MDQIGKMQIETLKKYKKNKKTHIFYFHHNLAPVILNTIRFLNRDKFCFTVCNFWSDNQTKDEFIKHGANVICLGAKRFLDLSAWSNFFKILFYCSPDIIHTILPELSIPVRLTNILFLRKKIIHTFQNPLSSEPSFWRGLNIVTLPLCDIITGVSAFVVEEIKETMPGLSKKLQITQNGIDPNFFYSCLDSNALPLRYELNLDNKDILLACVGRLNFQKGQDCLIRAIKILLQKGVKVKLLLIGPDFWNGYLQRLVKNLMLEKDVIFMGPRNDVARILQQIDIYVAPSRWEGLSFALCEAMLSKKPCIASDLPWHSELLFNKKTALSISVNNTKEIAEAIMWIIEHPLESKEIAQRAQKLIVEKFTVQNMANRYEKLYLKLLKD